MSSRPEDEPICDRLSRSWWAFALLALAAGAVTTLVAEGFPIVELEFAGSAERAAAVVGDSSIDVIQSAIFWDFLFLALYTPALFCAVVWARRGFTAKGARRIGIGVAFGAFSAGLFDAIENLAMLAYLGTFGDLDVGVSADQWMQIARFMAGAKFLLVALALIYFLGGVVLLAAHKFRSGRREAGQSP